MQLYKNERLGIACVVTAAILFVSTPLAGWWWVMVHMSEAASKMELIVLCLEGLVVPLVGYSVGAGGLAYVLALMHAVHDQPAADAQTPIDAQDPAESAASTTAVPPRYRTAISSWQWGDIAARAATDEDVAKLTAHYDFDGQYELVDAAPGAILEDGRKVLDIGVCFMYPHAAFLITR